MNSDLTVITKLVEYGATANHANPTLIHCAQIGNLNVVKFLLANDNITEKTKNVAIVTAASNNYLDILTCIVANTKSWEVNKKEIVVQILNTACQEGYPDIVRWCFSQGAQLTMLNAQVFIHQNVQTILDKKQREQNNQLLDAIRAKADIAQIQEVLALGAQLTGTDASGRNCFDIAVEVGYDAFLTKYRHQIPEDQLARLCENSLYTENESLFNVLSGHKAHDNINKVLLVAVSRQHWRLVFRLIDQGADVNTIDAQTGECILHFAQKADNEEAPNTLIKKLLSKGADPSIQDFQGNYPLWPPNRHTPLPDDIIAARADFLDIPIAALCHFSAVENPSRLMVTNDPNAPVILVNKNALDQLRLSSKKKWFTKFCQPLCPTLTRRKKITKEMGQQPYAYFQNHNGQVSVLIPYEHIDEHYSSYVENETVSVYYLQPNYLVDQMIAAIRDMQNEKSQFEDQLKNLQERYQHLTQQATTIWPEILPTELNPEIAISEQNHIALISLTAHLCHLNNQIAKCKTGLNNNRNQTNLTHKKITQLKIERQLNNEAISNCTSSSSAKLSDLPKLLTRSQQLAHELKRTEEDLAQSGREEQQLNHEMDVAQNLKIEVLCQLRKCLSINKKTSFQLPSNKHEQLIECPISLETIKNAKILPCGHTFSGDSAQNLLPYTVKCSDESSSNTGDGNCSQGPVLDANKSREHYRSQTALAALGWQPDDTVCQCSNCRTPFKSKDIRDNHAFEALKERYLNLGQSLVDMQKQCVVLTQKIAALQVYAAEYKNVDLSNTEIIKQDPLYQQIMSLYTHHLDLQTLTAKKTQFKEQIENYNNITHKLETEAGALLATAKAGTFKNPAEFATLIAKNQEKLQQHQQKITKYLQETLLYIKRIQDNIGGSAQAQSERDPDPQVDRPLNDETIEVAFEATITALITAEEQALVTFEECFAEEFKDLPEQEPLGLHLITAGDCHNNITVPVVEPSSTVTLADARTPATESTLLTGVMAQTGSPVITTFENAATVRVISSAADGGAATIEIDKKEAEEIRTANPYPRRN